MGVCLCMCRQTCDLPDFRCSIIAFLHMYLLGTYRATWFLSPSSPQPSSQVSIASPAFSVTSPWSRLLPPHVATRCLSPPGLLAIPIFYWHHRRDRLNSNDPRHSSALCETASSAQLCGGHRDTRRDRSEPESLATATPRALFPFSVLPAYLRHPTQFKDIVIIPPQFLSCCFIQLSPLLSGLAPHSLLPLAHRRSTISAGAWVRLIALLSPASSLPSRPPSHPISSNPGPITAQHTTTRARRHIQLCSNLVVAGLTCQSRVQCQPDLACHLDLLSQIGFQYYSNSIHLSARGSGNIARPVSLRVVHRQSPPHRLLFQYRCCYIQAVTPGTNCSLASHGPDKARPGKAPQGTARQRPHRGRGHEINPRGSFRIPHSTLSRR